MKKIRLNLNTVYIGATIIVLGTLLITMVNEFGGIWIKGISYVANDIDNYSNIAFPAEGEYTVKIDLSDLESNEGKILYDDGDSRIYVSKVMKKKESNYEVLFRSRGNFSLSGGGATLVSGIEHTSTNNGIVNNFRAEANATYRGNTYKLSPSGSSGLNYRDGDEFGFYLVPPDETINIDLEEEAKIEITVTNLYVNLWVGKYTY